ncbi:MAG: AEC family transporter [Fimbriimonadales bacterium]|nr:AEC family transporter [Fimbriimonadales bacterium]
MEFLNQFVFLFWDVVLPILLIAACGFALERKRPLAMQTLTALQVNVFMPAFMVARVAESDLSWGEMGFVVAAMLLATLAMGAPVWLLLRRRRVAVGSAAVLVLAAAVFNSGNFGIPLAERAYGRAGGGVQALVLLVSNIAMWLGGYLLLASANGGIRKALGEYVRTPLFASLALALALKAGDWRLPNPIQFSLDSIAGGLVPVALMTLGAQLASRVRWPRWRAVAPVLAAKLLAMPAVMGLVVWALGLWPWPGAMLVVAASAPSAVNTFILALELDADSELAAECVFWTTVLSAITVTLALTVVKSLGGHPPA